MAALPAELERTIVENLRTERNGLRAGGIAGAVLMVLIAAIALLALDPPERNLWVLAAGCIPLFLLLVIPSLFDPAKAKILETLRTRADGIVWMYVRRQVGRHQGAWIVLGFDDGSSARVTAKLGQEDPFLRDLATLAPRATLGFSPELAARFKAEPRSLRKAS